MDGAMLVESGLPEALSLQVLNKMRNDLLTKVVKNDTTILRFGVSLLRKLGPKRANDIAQKMRQLARISLRLAKKLKHKKALSLDEFISGNKFDVLLEAVHEECELFQDNVGRFLYKNPNLALNLGHSFLKLAKIKVGASIRTRDMNSKLEAEEFMTLHSSEFTDIVATPAHASVKLMTRTLDEFPDASDLLKLKNYQSERSKILCKALTSAQPNGSDWRELAEITMSRIIVYNACRGSEVADLRVEEYNRRSNVAHTNVIANMSEEDLQLMESMKVIEIFGKRIRPVPILLDAYMMSCMEVLYLSREKYNVLGDFFFSIPGLRDSKFSFFLVLRKVAIASQMAQPHLLSTTRMRKHHATMAQYLNMAPAQTEWMSCHMGHDVAIHKKNYRLHTPAVEITKVGPLLNKLDSGVVEPDSSTGRKSQKKRHFIDSTDVEPSDDDDHEHFENKKGGTGRTTQRIEKKKKWKRIILEGGTGRTTQRIEKKKKWKRIILDSDASQSKVDMPMKNNEKRVPYTEQELNLFRKLFSKYTKPPTYEDARSAQQVMPSLRSRTLAQITSRAWSLIKSLSQTTSRP